MTAAAGTVASHGVSAGPVVAIVAIVAAVVILFVLVVSYVLHQRALNAKDIAATATGPARVQPLGRTRRPRLTTAETSFLAERERPAPWLS